MENTEPCFFDWLSMDILILYYLFQKKNGPTFSVFEIFTFLRNFSGILEILLLVNSWTTAGRCLKRRGNGFAALGIEKLKIKRKKKEKFLTDCIQTNILFPFLLFHFYYYFFSEKTAISTIKYTSRLNAKEQKFKIIIKIFYQEMGFVHFLCLFPPFPFLKRFPES